MKRVVKLTEQDLYRIVKRVIKEQETTQQPDQSQSNPPTPEQVARLNSNEPLRPAQTGLTGVLEPFNSLPDNLKRVVEANLRNPKGASVPLISPTQLQGIKLILKPEYLNLSNKTQGPEYTRSILPLNVGAVKLQTALNGVINSQKEYGDPKEIVSKLNQVLGKDTTSIKIENTNFSLVPSNNGFFILYYNGRPASDLLASQTQRPSQR